MTNHEKIIFLNNLGYKAISENLSKSLKVECKHGHIFGRMFDDFKRGSVNCPECDRLGKLNYLNNLGYKAVSENLADSLHVECPKGHIFKRAFGDFKNGKINCPKCDIRNKLDYLNNLGYEVVSENLSKGLEVRCSNGHVFKRAFGKFKDGFTTCPKCKDTNKVNYINNLGYEIISNNLADELKVRCIQGHIFNRTYGNFKQGKIICPTCNPSTSSFEKKYLIY